MHRAQHLHWHTISGRFARVQILNSQTQQTTMSWSITSHWPTVAYEFTLELRIKFKTNLKIDNDRAIQHKRHSNDFVVLLSFSPSCACMNNHQHISFFFCFVFSFFFYGALFLLLSLITAAGCFFLAYINSSSFSFSSSLFCAVVFSILSLSPNVCAGSKL